MIYNKALTEGQQADEYRARKAKEAEDKKKADQSRDDRRYNYNANKSKALNGVASGIEKKGKADTTTYGDLVKSVDKNVASNATSWDRRVGVGEVQRRPIDDVLGKGNNLKYTYDAAARNRRRHHESAIFESVKFI